MGFDHADDRAGMDAVRLRSPLGWALDGIKYVASQRSSRAVFSGTGVVVRTTQLASNWA